MSLTRKSLLEEALSRKLAEEDFYEFVKQAWPHIEGRPFVDGWVAKCLCLPYESEIITEDGIKSIGDIFEFKYEGQVLSFCHKSNSIQWKKIKHRMKSNGLPLYNLILNNGIKLSLTGDHPVFVEGVGYARASDIKVGDVVLQALREEISSKPIQSKGWFLRNEMFRKIKIKTRKIHMPNMRWKDCLGKQKILSEMLCENPKKGKMGSMPQSSEGNTKGDFAVGKSYVVSVECGVRIPNSVYNIEVEDNNNYFVQNILVHNCEHLEEVYYGRIKRLNINLPPRTAKSTLVSILFQCWCWLKDPSIQFLGASYSEKLAVRDNTRARRLLKSDWFQKRWGDRITLSDDQDTKMRVDNMQNGYRIAVGLSGTVRGEGGDILVMDDINDVSDRSEVQLENAIEFYTQVLPTRYNDFKTGRLINVQQRLHMRDVSGYIIANQSKEFVSLILPMEFEEHRKCVTVPLKSTNGKPWEDPRTKEGELLWPERIGQKELKILKAALGGEYAVAGQLQQRPAPSEGGMIKRGWWMPWKEEGTPRISFVIQAWDTGSSEKKTAAYSACTTWGIFKNEHNHPCLILLGVWRKKVEVPELYKQVARMARDYRATTEDRPINEFYKPDIVLIEEKASGIPVLQSLRRTGAQIVGWRPDKFGDKIERVRKVTPLIESGRVYVPYKAPDFTKMKSYADLLVEQAAVFPRGDSRDLLDTVSMVLQRCIVSGWVLHSLEQSAAQEDDWRRDYIGNDDRPFY